MSPAAASTEPQSPISSLNPNPNSHYNHFQNSDANSSNNFTFNFNCSFSSTMGPEKAKLVGRKPRLVKMRKKSGTETGKSKQSDSVNSDSSANSFAENLNRVSEANCVNGSDNISIGDSKVSKNNKFSKFDYEAEFVFGKINSDSVNYKTVEFEVGTSKCSTKPNLNVENVGCVFGANKGSSKLDSNVESVGFVFGADKGISKLDCNMENGAFVSEDSKKGSSKLGTDIDNGGFVFGASKGSSKLDPNVKYGGFVFGNNNGSSKLDSNVGNVDFVFGANKSGLDLDSSSQMGGFVVGGSKKGSLQKLVDEGNLVFGAEKNKAPENGVRFSFGPKDCKLSLNSNFNPRGSAGNMGYVGANEDKKCGFVFGARNTQGEGAREQGGVMYDKSTNGYNSPFSSNLENVGSGKVAEESGTTSFGVFDNSSFIFRATKEKLSSENEQSGGKLDKETMDKLESVARAEQMSHLKPDSQKANSSSEKEVSFSSEIKLDDEMNKSNRENVDNLHNFVKSPNNNVQEIPVSKLSEEMKRWNINGSERVDGDKYTETSKDNLFVNVDTKFVFGSSQKTFGLSTEKDGENNRSLRNHRSKRSKEKLRRQTPAQDHMSKGSSSQNNDESPRCCSPMDFSPYQTTDAAPSSAAFETKDTMAEQGHDIRRSDMTSEESHSTGLDNIGESNLNDEKNGNVSTSSSAQDGLSAIRHQYRKKYKLKVGNGSCRTTQSQKAAFTSSSAQSSPISFNSLRMKKATVESEIMRRASQEHDKQGNAEVATEQSCEIWRIRGNQAYKAGHLSKAEEYYTKGINSIPDAYVSEFCIQPLLLCYSNRAATRMSLGRIHEALVDCKLAASLDPSFLKVKLRAANCHLVLGEVEDAMVYYNNCMEPEGHVCLDRRITIEAADGLLKAQKVAEYMRQSAELLQRRSSDAAKSALEITAEALKISCYSEKLFEMKGDALCMLSMYEEVIQVCEQTLHIAEKNSTAYHSANVNDNISQDSSSRLWRWRLMSKSHYHMGRLELALDFIEKQEQFASTINESGSMTQESSISLAVTIRELLCHKKAGNEAFKSGRHAEAVEHYTAAISKSVESRPFAAICFCNRAAAHQASGQIADAIADCSLAIALDGNYPKAVSRRATLHEMIRDYEQAACDIQRLISLLGNQSQEEQSDTHNRSGGSVKELQRARNRLSSLEKKVKKGSSLDLYLILGVKASDTEADIKKAYRKAALRHHPDKAAQLLARNDVGDDGKQWKEIVEKVHKDADRLFKMIGEAYGVLSDSEKRSKYNDEEELREVLRSNNNSSHSGRPYDGYSSPSERGSWSGRHSDSQFGRSGNRRYWQESWREYSSSQSRW